MLSDESNHPATIEKSFGLANGEDISPGDAGENRIEISGVCLTNEKQMTAPDVAGPAEVADLNRPAAIELALDSFREERTKGSSPTIPMMNGSPAESKAWCGQSIKREKL